MPVGPVAPKTPIFIMTAYQRRWAIVALLGDVYLADERIK
jgi:hypothetical protein